MLQMESNDHSPAQSILAFLWSKTDPGFGEMTLVSKMIQYLSLIVIIILILLEK